MLSRIFLCLLRETFRRIDHMRVRMYIKKRNCMYKSTCKLNSVLKTHWRGYVMLFVLFFKKRVETCLRIYWIPKMMVQFCYLRLSLAIETVSYHLLRPMARVGGHGGLKLNLQRGRLCLLRPQAFETWDVQFYTIWAEVSSSMAWLLAFAKSFPSFVSRVVGLFMPLC